MEAAARHRLLLSLRSEQALGLRSIPRGSVAEVLEDPAPLKHLHEEPGATKAVTTRVTTQPPAQDAPRSTRQAPASPPVAPATPVSLPTAPPFDAPVLSPDQKRARLIAMEATEVRTCPKCRLCNTRTHTVFGEGDHDAKIFFIGEGPGENEDLTGRPFVGKAGQLLDKMIAAMGLLREQVYIANIVKCRPPNNRVPALDEVATCTPYLERQIEIVRPQAIVTLGRPAASYMLANPKLTMGSVRGRWHTWRGIKLMPTFHPSYVLRTYTEEIRKAVWDDLQQVMEALGMSAPPRAGPSM